MLKKFKFIKQNKKLTSYHKELLNLFNDLLNMILTDKTLESEIQESRK